MEISRLLTLPEGKTLEFKRNLSSPKPVLRTLVAFANTAGGTLIIGRADDGSVVGVDDVLAEEERLASLIADSIAPAMMPEIEAVTVDDKTLLLVRVAHWPGPFYLKEKGPVDGVYVRLGSTNRKADATLLGELGRLHSHSAFDQLPCAGTSPGDLDREAVLRWFSGKNRNMDAAALESLGILVRHGSGRMLSNGGIILFGKADVRQH
jgi:ATP-dependent DNA helicase RecG